MSLANRIPSHIDYGHRMAEIAAEMAGYKLDELRDWEAPRDAAKAVLYRSFVKKGFKAVELLGPAIVHLETVEAEKIPDDIYKAGHARGEHMVTITREWRGLSIAELAERSGLSVALITAIEAREVEANEMHEFAMAGVLNVSPHALTDWTLPPSAIDRIERMAARGAEIDERRQGDE